MTAGRPWPAVAPDIAVCPDRMLGDVPAMADARGDMREHRLRWTDGRSTPLEVGRPDEPPRLSGDCLRQRP